MGIAHMRSKGNEWPFGLDDETVDKMKSQENDWPLGMDDQTMI
jgi:hypothetical protein